MSSLHMRSERKHRMFPLPALTGTAVAIGLFCASSGTVFAKYLLAKSVPPAIGSPGVASEPRLTTASYGDWVLRCMRVGAENALRLCEVAQTMQVQGRPDPVAQIAVGRLPNQEDLRVTILLPANVSFPSSVRITQAKDNGNGLELAWRRCIPGGCLADAAAPEAVLESWRGADEAARITFKDAESREITVPLSFRGLGPALDALAKERS